MRRWQYVVIGLVFGVTTACDGAPPSASTTNVANASSTAPSIAPSLQASTLAPSPSSAAVKATSTATNASNVICQLTQSGGLVGATQTVTVYENGDVVAERDRPAASTGTTQATPAQLDALRAAVSSTAWQGRPTALHQATAKQFHLRTPLWRQNCYCV